MTDRPRTRHTRSWVVKWEIRPRNKWVYDCRVFPDNEEGRHDAYKFCLRMMERVNVKQDVRRLRVCRPSYLFGKARTTQMRDGRIIRPRLRPAEKPQLEDESIELDHLQAKKLAARWQTLVAEVRSGVSNKKGSSNTKPRKREVRQAFAEVPDLPPRDGGSTLPERSSALCRDLRVDRLEVPSANPEGFQGESAFRRAARLLVPLHRMQG